MQSPATDGDPISNALAGYRLAWVYRRQLLPVLAAVLAPMLIGLLALDLVLGNENLAIINGSLVVGSDGGALSWIKLALMVASWLLALTAAAATLVGAVRGSPVSVRKALRVACQHFPVLALGLCVAGGAIFIMVWIAAGAGGAIAGPLAVVLVLGLLTAAALVSARMLLAVVSMPSGGSAWVLTRGRVMSTAGAFLLGGVGFPLLLAYARDRLRAAGGWPVLVDAVDVVLLTGGVAAQSAILAYVYLRRRDELRPDIHRSVEAATIDGRLAQPASRWIWIAVAAMVAPMLVSTGVAVANPHGAPSMRWQGDGPPGGAVAVAWPAGQHPIIVSNIGVRFCEDDLCDSYVGRHGGPTVGEGWGMAGIAPDGTVTTAALTGGTSNGGPFIHYARCTRQDGCREAWVPVRAAAEEPLATPELAVSSAPDGATWFAVGLPSPDNQPGEPAYRIMLVRCADLACAKPERHHVGTVPRTPDDKSRWQRARLSIGPDGRPVAAFWIGGSVHLVTCEPVTCTHPRAASNIAAPSDAQWTTLGGLSDGVVSFAHGGLQLGERRVPLATDLAHRSGALAIAAAGIYAAAAVPANQPSGFRVTIGARPEYWQQILWQCDRPGCRQPRRVPLDVYEGPAQTGMLAVGADGRVLVVRSDRITLVTPPK